MRYLLIAAALTASTPALSNSFNIEAGLGIPYGILGANANYAVGDNIEVFGGLGIALGSTETNGDVKFHTGTGYALGGRYYVTEHIRLVAAYGTIGGTIVRQNTSSSDAVFETVAGAVAGLGYYTSKERGFSIDVLYVDTTALDDKADELKNDGFFIEDADTRNIKLSFGYRF